MPEGSIPLARLHLAAHLRFPLMPNIETLHDPLRHLKYLRQSLAQDSESIGFFLSAGCPLSVPMPAGKWPLIPDVANLTKAINAALEKNQDYKKLLLELTKAGRNTENIEDILSFLRSLASVAQGGEVRGLSEEMLLSLEKAICEAIITMIDVELPADETPYHRLCNWIRSIDRKTAVELFTTNYDLLLEQALEHNEVPYFDGFVGSRRPFFDLRAVEDGLIPTHWSRVWKIHGSINWYRSGEDKSRSVYRSSEIKKDASHLIYPSHLKYEESRKMPYLALIDQLNRFIRRKSSFLVMCGYSFNDGHLNDTIVNALKANPTAMVLGLQYGTYQRESNGAEVYPEAYRLARKQHNLNIWTFDRAIIGTTAGHWSKPKDSGEGDTELGKFITPSTAQQDGHPSMAMLKMGDFEVFSQFLKQIIGTNPES